MVSLALESGILTALLSTGGGVAFPWMSELFGAVYIGNKSSYLSNSYEPYLMFAVRN